MTRLATATGDVTVHDVTTADLDLDTGKTGNSLTAGRETNVRHVDQSHRDQPESLTPAGLRVGL